MKQFAIKIITLILIPTITFIYGFVLGIRTEKKDNRIRQAIKTEKIRAISQKIDKTVDSCKFCDSFNKLYNKCQNK